MIHKTIKTRNHLHMKPQVDQILDKKCFVIVDQKGKLITHRDGHLLIFHRRKDAREWIYNNKADDTVDTCSTFEWKIKRLNICLEE